MKDYLFTISLIILLAIFYLGLPDLDRTTPPLRKGRSKKAHVFSIEKYDIIAIAVITVIFGIVDFWKLGNTESPESFVRLGESTAILSLEEDKSPMSLMFFTGVSEGTYDIDFSEDGQNYTRITSYTQSYADVLRWVNISSYNSMKPKYIRISCEGNAFLGEVGLLDENNEFIDFSCDVPQLCDEQEKLCSSNTYMNSSYFDEIYHARTAWEHLNAVYPYEVSHPPLGKIIIGLGISLFGMTPFGWRFSGTLFGVLMIPVIYVFSKELFGSLRVSVCTTLILATDFMHFVQTRIATIDSYAVFFILLMYLFMYRYLSGRKLSDLAICGIFFGLGAASKWTCLYAGAGLALLWLIDRILHRDEGLKPLIKNICFCLLFFLLVPCVIYYLSYIPYGIALNIKPVFSKAYFRTVIDNQKFMFTYHSGLSAEHPYSSKWYQWILDIRPILYYLEYFDDGTRSSFGAFLNPILCWGGLVALFVLMYCALLKKEKRAAFILIGYLAQLIPWMFITRLTFEYHYFPCSVFLVLALGYVFSLMESGTKHWKAYVYSFVAVSTGLFIMFMPVLSGIRINTYTATRLLHWLKTWPF